MSHASRLTFGGGKGDLGSQGQALFSSPSPHPTGEDRAVIVGEHNRGRWSGHAPTIGCREGNPRTKLDQGLLHTRLQAPSMALPALWVDAEARYAV